MTAGSPVVSVCLPTHNGAAVVGETLASILGQDLADIEVIVTDDASGDATLDIVRAIAVDDERVVVLGSERVGPTANWWRGVERSRGEFVKVMGQDDLLRSDCLVRQVAALREHPGVVLASCRRQLIGPTGNVVRRSHGLQGLEGRRSGRAVRRAVLAWGTNLVGEPAATLCRRTDLLAAGPFRAEHGYVTDLDQWLRVLDRGDLWGDPEPLVSFRLHADSWSSAVASEQGRAMRRLVREEASRHPDDIGRARLLLGLATATAAAWARRAMLRRVVRA